MNSNSKIGAALVGGYLLGRTKKAKMAIGLGMYLAGKKLNLSPQQLVKTVANSPVVGQLSDQVRKDLIGNTKSALTSAVTQRAGSLADSLHERTLSMNDPDRGAEDAEDAGIAEGEEPEGADGEERRARKQPAATGKTAKSAKATRNPASGSANGKAPSGGSRTGGTRSGSARKTASSGARKTAGGARRTAATTASGGARKAANRGGGNG